jgi:NlpC/P60 family
MRSVPPPQLYPRRRPELGGVAVLLVLTVLAALVAPHARTLRGLVTGELAHLPTIRLPARSPAAGDGARAAWAVTFALGQRGKPYRWGAEGPLAFDCSGLTWAAWQAAGVTIPGPRPASSPASLASGLGSSPATCSSTAPMGRRVGMWPWWSAEAGWSRPWAAASRSG